MNLAKQSTPKTFILGPILDSLGAAKIDEVVASIKVTKNGTVGAVDASDTLVHSHTGHYIFTAVDGDDFGTVGEVEFSLNSGTNAMAPVKFQVVPANVYDSIVAGSDKLDVAVVEQSNIDFGALQKASITAAVPTVIDIQNGLGTTAQLNLIQTATDLITAARMGALTDWINGGRLDLILDAISAATALGPGAISWSYTVTDSINSAPIDGVEVWVSTDSAGLNVIASGTTDEYGIVTFMLDSGIIFVWRKRAGYNFTNPQQNTV